jgi:hypothetical protein
VPRLALDASDRLTSPEWTSMDQTEDQQGQRDMGVDFNYNFNHLYSSII